MEYRRIKIKSRILGTDYIHVNNKPCDDQMATINCVKCYEMSAKCAIPTNYRFLFAILCDRVFSRWRAAGKQTQTERDQRICATHKVPSNVENTINTCQE